jgi:hypothetical protein
MEEPQGPEIPGPGSGLEAKADACGRGQMTVAPPSATNSMPLT